MALTESAQVVLVGGGWPLAQAIPPLPNDLLDDLLDVL